MKFLKTILLFTFFIFFTSCDESGDGLFIFPDTPYLGITHTLEGGPEPIGNIDVTDWLPIPELEMSIYPAYSNPTDSEVNLEFRINNSFSISGLIYLHHPITNQIEIIVNDDQELLAGIYRITVDLEELKFQKGIIRAYFNFGGHISYGDIFYK